MAEAELPRKPRPGAVPSLKRSVSTLFASIMMEIYEEAICTMRRSFGILKCHKSAYIALNGLFHSTVAISMLVATAFPWLHETALERVNAQLDGYKAGRIVTRAYSSGNVPWAAFLTFVINLSVGSFTTITLPSLLCPYSGIALVMYRAVEWGLIFAMPKSHVKLLPHYVTMIIEGQAYVIAAVATWLQGRMLLKYKRYGFTSYWAGYRAGLRVSAHIYSLVIPILFVAAIYEAVEVIYLPLDSVGRAGQE